YLFRPTVNGQARQGTGGTTAITATRACCGPGSSGIKNRPPTRLDRVSEGYNHSVKRHSGVCCFCCKSAAKPALVAALPPRLRARGSAFLNTPIPPVSPVLSGRDQALTNFPDRTSLTRSQLLTTATVQRDCGNCGVVLSGLDRVSDGGRPISAQVQ